MEKYSGLQNNEENIDEKKEKEVTSARLMKLNELNILASLGNTELFGAENLENLEGKKIIFVVTHMSDLDLPLAISKLGHMFDLIITSQSTNLHITENPAGYISLSLAGKKNFLPLDNKRGIAKFNPDNFIPINEALEHGKAVVIAGHNPTYNGILGSGNIGPTYLAEISGAIIVPVAINFIFDENNKKEQQKTDQGSIMQARPDAEVHIGKPFYPDHIEGIEHIKEIMDKRINGEKLTKEELDKFKIITKAMREQSDNVIGELAKMLPESKRGERKMRK